MLFSRPAYYTTSTPSSYDAIGENFVTEQIKQPFSVRLLPAVRAAGKKAADDDHRTLGSLIEKLLVEHLQANGYLPGSKTNKRK